MSAGALLYIQHRDRAQVLSFAKDGEEVLPPHILHRRNIYYCVEEKKICQRGKSATSDAIEYH